MVIPMMLMGRALGNEDIEYEVQWLNSLISWHFYIPYDKENHFNSSNLWCLTEQSHSTPILSIAYSSHIVINSLQILPLIYILGAICTDQLTLLRTEMAFEVHLVFQ